MLIQTAHQHKSPDVTVHDTTKIIKRVLWSRSTSNLSIVVVFFQFGIVHSVCVCIRYLAVTVTCRLDRHLTTTVRRLRQRELGSVCAGGCGGPGWGAERRCRFAPTGSALVSLTLPIAPRCLYGLSPNEFGITLYAHGQLTLIGGRVSWILHVFRRVTHSTTRIIIIITP